MEGPAAALLARCRDLYDASREEGLKDSYASLFTRFQEVPPLYLQEATNNHMD